MVRGLLVCVAYKSWVAYSNESRNWNDGRNGEVSLDLMVNSKKDTEFHQELRDKFQQKGPKLPRWENSEH